MSSSDDYREIDILRRMLAEVRRADVRPSLLRSLAMALYRVGRLDEAVERMTQAVELTPTPSYVNDLGTLLLRRGDSSAAVERYRQAVSADRNFVLGWSNLGDALQCEGRLPEAVDAYRHAMVIDPTFASVHAGLASTLSQSGDDSAAIDVARRALARFPASARLWRTLAVVERRRKNLVAAIEAVQRAVGLAPEDAEMWHTLAGLYDDAGDQTAAADAYRRALSLDPSLVEAQFDLAALGQAPTPTMMPPEYTIRLFDDFAATFERTLVDELEYCAPEALRSLMNRRWAAAGFELGAAKLDIVDLGCGTGLVGRQFRDVAQSLVGVDLAPAMLVEAQRTGLYDRLERADVVNFLKSHPDSFDLALAADLLIYIGDLEPLFAAASKSLRPGGWLAISIESIDEGEYLLRPTRRYAHSLAYIASLAVQNGLTIEEVAPLTIRKGGLSGVAGHLIALRKS